MNSTLFARLNYALHLLVPQNSLSVRFASGTLWYLVGTILAQGLGLLSSIIVARLLGLIDFGKYGIIISTIGTFGVFASLGLGLTATKYIAEHRSTDPQRLGRILGLTSLVIVGSAGLFTGISLILAPALSSSLLGDPNLADELRWGSILLFFSVIMGVQIGALSGFEAFRTISFTNLIRGILNFPLLIIGVWFWGVSGAVFASGMVTLVVCWFNAIALRREAAKFHISLQFHHIYKELPILWRFSLPAMLSSAMVFPTLWVANTMIVNQPQGYAQIGLINAANQWTTIIALLPNVVAGVAIPMISSLFRTDSIDKQSTYGIELVNTMNQAILWPISVLFMLGAPMIASAYGQGFDQGYVVFILLIGGYAIGYVGNAIGTLLISKGKMWLGALLNLTWSMVILTITYFGIARTGAISLGVGIVVAYFLLLVWPALYLDYKKELPPTLARRVISGGIVMLLVMVISIWVPPEVATKLAIPLALCSLPLSIHALSPYEFRQSIWTRVQQLRVKTSS